jgi:hypothetical protein
MGDRLHIYVVGQVLTTLLLPAAASAGILSPGFSTGCVCLGQSSSSTRQQDVLAATSVLAAHWPGLVFLQGVFIGTLCCRSCLEMTAMQRCSCAACWW